MKYVAYGRTSSRAFFAPRLPRPSTGQYCSARGLLLGVGWWRCGLRTRGWGGRATVRGAWCAAVTADAAPCRRASWSLTLSGQPLDVTAQVLCVREAEHVPAEQLRGGFRRFAAGVQSDQQARDDRGVHLQFDAVGAVADQMPAAQHVLEEPENSSTCHRSRYRCATTSAGRSS